MSAPNRNTLWGETLIEELVASGLEAAVVAPGSRSTPLAVALADADVPTFSQLDERSAAFFALGRGRATGAPTAVVCTSGTAAAELHPAVLEADRARVPLLCLTADRPPELWDSGANQTVDQSKLYGDAVRWYRRLPEPEPDPRKLRGLRTTAARAVAATTGPPAGPVHLDVPFRKPLEPTPVEGDVPGDLGQRAPRAAGDRDRPYVRTHGAESVPEEGALGELVEALERADRGLLVCGPADDPTPAREALAELCDATGFPVLADPLSGLRFGEHTAGRPVLGGYDGYLAERVTAGWPDPDVVVRFGAAPTSKVLREYLARTDARSALVDPAAGWREATYTASDRIAGDSTVVASYLADRLDRAAGAWTDRLREAEERYWELLEDELGTTALEGAVLAAVADDAPESAAVFVSNSMPVRDLDRFARPRTTDLRMFGNRGASGIDGIVSTALGIGSTTAEPLVCVLGDLGFYHDMNGLLAVARCGVDATIVLLNNDGGGIFHALPIEAFDPPFTELFRTPHGLDFEPAADLYGLEFCRPEGMAAFRVAYRESVASEGTQVIELRTDAEASHRRRERLAGAVAAELGDR